MNKISIIYGLLFIFALFIDFSISSLNKKNLNILEKDFMKDLQKYYTTQIIYIFISSFFYLNFTIGCFYPKTFYTLFILSSVTLTFFLIANY
jgi:hypothetical protein